MVNSSKPQIHYSKWVVSADEAQQLLAQGATFLDAREPALQESGCLQGAVPIGWEQFSQASPPFQGKLLEDNQLLTQKLQAFGIFNGTPVIVFGDPVNGGGEDGRIVWMLRTLGHQNAVLVDGGDQALVKAGIPTVTAVANQPPTRGDFVVSRTTAGEIGRDELKACLGCENLAIVDAREPGEYAGETPYGEQRGGHIPGAISLYYKILLGEDGKLLPRGEIVALLQQYKVTSEAEIIAYCTGGIRSGWLTSVLTDLGFTVKNYAGSMWEWSAFPVEDYPLEEEEKINLSCPQN
ncbi:MAG: rhodanese-like domain-containing protein [Coleofasciculus sp. C1-SOL-03]